MLESSPEGSLLFDKDIWPLQGQSLLTSCPAGRSRAVWGRHLNHSNASGLPHQHRTRAVPGCRCLFLPCPVPPAQAVALQDV